MDGLRRIQVNRLHLAVQIAWQLGERNAPVSGGNPQDMSVRTLYLLVANQHRLHEVVTGRQIGETGERIAQRGTLQHGNLTGAQLLDIHAGEHGASQANRGSRLGGGAPGDRQYQAAGDGSARCRGRDGNFKSPGWTRSTRGAGCGRRRVSVSEWT